MLKIKWQHHHVGTMNTVFIRKYQSGKCTETHSLTQTLGHFYVCSEKLQPIRSTERMDTENNQLTAQKEKLQDRHALSLSELDKVQTFF